MCVMVVEIMSSLKKMKLNLYKLIQKTLSKIIGPKPNSNSINLYISMTHSYNKFWAKCVQQLLR